MTATRLLPAFLLLAACSATNPGTGSGTLLVNADVEGKSDSTEIEIEVKKDMRPVFGANVTVRDLSTGSLTTLEGKGDGVYKTTLNRYVRSVAIKIVSGDDALEAAIEGPAKHTITRPPDNAIVRRAGGEVLSVRWEADGRADEVEVQAEGTERIRLELDTFGFDIPLSSLKNGEQRLRVERANGVDLAGGASGSLLRARYKAEARFTLQD